jgi:hypothetical protein
VACTLRSGLRSRSDARFRGVLRTSLTAGSVAGVSSHEKNVFFSCVDEPMKKVKVDSRGTVNCFPFCGEYRIWPRKQEVHLKTLLIAKEIELLALPPIDLTLENLRRYKSLKQWPEKWRAF